MKWTKSDLIYAGFLAIIGAILELAGRTYLTGLWPLVATWLLAFPLSPLCFLIDVFLGVMLGMAFGNAIAIPVVVVLDAIILYAAGLLQANVLRRVVHHRRATLPNGHSRT